MQWKLKFNWAFPFVNKGFKACQDSLWHLYTLKTVIWQSRSNRPEKKCPRVPVWVRGGRCNHYLGNAQIEVMLNSKVLPLEPESIHSKSWSPWSPDNFDFSAKRLSENAKIIRFALLVELNTANHLQVLLKLQIKHINTASADLFALRMCAWKLPNCNLAPSP